MIQHFRGPGGLSTTPLSRPKQQELPCYPTKNVVALTQTNKHSKCWLPSYRADPADRTVNTGEPVMQDNLPGELAYLVDVAGLGKLGVWKR